jgi:cytochrome P450
MTETRIDDAVGLDDFQLLDPGVQQCPHRYYASMRENAPVFATEVGGTPILLVTRYQDVLDIIRDTETFSSNTGSGTSMPVQPELAEEIRKLYRTEGGYERVGTMLTIDPPEQTRYRKLVSRAFTVRAVSDLEPAIREVAGGLIARWVNDGKVEFVHAFAVPLPVATIARALNVPDDRLADFKRWSDASIAGIGTIISIDERLDAEREVIEFQKYFAEQLGLRRTEPQDDILTNLLNARIDREDLDLDEALEDLNDDPLTIAEMLSIIQQLLVAGNETTTKFLTEMMRNLCDTPDEWAALKADPVGRARGVVDESLRLATPTQGMFRIVTRDCEIAGAQLRAGDRVVAMFAAANRDPSVFEDPDAFCPAREEAKDHLAFGKGIHYCLGAALSRLEGKIAAEELGRRLGTIALDSSNTFDYHPSFMLRGLKRLDVHVTPADG